MCIVHAFEELFFKLCFSDLYFNGLVNLLCMATAVVGVVLNRRREESIDKGRLAKPRFASNLKACQPLDNRARSEWRSLTIIVKAAPRLATILCLDANCKQEHMLRDTGEDVPLIG